MRGLRQGAGDAGGQDEKGRQAGGAEIELLALHDTLPAAARERRDG